MAKKPKKKIRRLTPDRMDKMTFEKREKARKKLAQEAAYTKAFKTRQSFGPASECRSISISEYLATGGDPNILGDKNV